MKSKMVAIFATLMIALMVAGFAYAHWSETLLISGTVKTGELNLELSCKCDDNDNYADKNVADITCSVTDLPTEPDSVTITITNAYPCYEVYVTIDVENVGTVPADLKSVEVSYPDKVIPVDKDGDGFPDLLFYDANENGIADDDEWMAEIKYLDIEDFSQIHKGETKYIKMTVHFTNPGLPENWTGTFTITLVYENWSP